MNGINITLLIIISILLVVNFCNKRESFTNDDDSVYVRNLKRVVESIYPDAIKMNILPGRKSMTIEKKTIYICLKDHITKQYYTFDVLLYVTLHEIAHVMSKSYSSHSHNDEFHKNFQELLRTGRSLGYFSDNVDIPTNYCGS